MRNAFSFRRRKRDTASISDQQQRSMLCDKLSFTAAEAYKQLRANLLFALPDENKCRLVGITSAIRGEGKSTTAINLAYTMAETGRKVLLIDADMRLPSVAKKLGVDGTPGLSNLLAGMNRVSDVVRPSPFMGNFHIMPAGDVPPNPSELLGSGQMERTLADLAQSYDFIMIDLPPVEIVSDALSIANFINGIVVAVRANYSDRGSLGNCIQRLEVLEGKVLGFVMTGMPEQQKGYGRYGRYGHYGRSYGYGYGDGYGYGYGYGKSRGKSAVVEAKPVKPGAAPQEADREKTGQKHRSAEDKKHRRSGR